MLVQLVPSTLILLNFISFLHEHTILFGETRDISTNIQY